MPPLLDLLLQPLQALWRKHRDALTKPNAVASANGDDIGELLEDDLLMGCEINPRIGAR